MEFRMRTNGKVLLTGEYFVTDGAVALALPTLLGQSISVTPNQQNTAELNWKSYDCNNDCWFACTFDKKDLSFSLKEDDDEYNAIAERLQNILLKSKRLNPDFLNDDATLNVETHLEFDLEWGLGSSATLITMVASWAKIDPFQLLAQTFGGSGYDIVTSTAHGPVIFQRFNGKNRWEKAAFDPPFKENLYFLYLDKKQDSRAALVHYLVTPEDQRIKDLGRITQISHDINQYTQNLEDFDALVLEHENCVSKILQTPTVKSELFEDYWGAVKSLGAWGGDFVLVTSNKTEADTKTYFAEKGFNTIFKYDDFIKQYHK